MRFMKKLLRLLCVAFVMILAVLPALAFAEENIFIDNGGREIPATVTLPEGEGPFPLVVMAHGHAGDRQVNGAFRDIAKALADAGIASIRMDFAGCGESKAPFAENTLTSMVSDVEACRLYALANYPINPGALGIFGYSMGGRVALMIAAEDTCPYTAVALLAPATFPFDTRENQIGYGIAKKQGVLQQAFAGRMLDISPEWYEDLFATDALMAALPAIENAMVIYGGKDVTVLPRYCEACADMIGAEKVLIENADHYFGFWGYNPEAPKTVRDSLVRLFAGALTGR